MGDLLYGFQIASSLPLRHQMPAEALARNRQVAQDLRHRTSHDEGGLCVRSLSERRFGSRLRSAPAESQRLAVKPTAHNGSQARQTRTHKDERAGFMSRSGHGWRREHTAYSLEKLVVNLGE